MRLAIGLAVVAVAFAAAVYVHQRRTSYTYAARAGCSVYFDPNCEEIGYRHPSWEDPVAVLLGIGGLSVAAGIVAAGRSTVGRPG